jgi:hypothetical protein
MISGLRPVRHLSPEDRLRARALIARVDAREAQADADHLATIRRRVDKAPFRHRVLSAVDKKKLRREVS